MRQLLKQVFAFVGVILLGVVLLAKVIPGGGGMLMATGLPQMIGLSFASAPAQADQKRRGGGGAQVLVMSPDMLTQTDHFKAIGNGRARALVEVKAQAAGQIIDRPARSDQPVSAGDILFELDREAQEIALARAELAHTKATEDLARLNRLKTTGAATAVQLRDAELALKTADLNLRQAQFDLNERTVRAPIDGTIGLIEFNTGDHITAQDVLGVIADRRQILVEFNLPERVADRLAQGQAFTARAIALDGLNVTGQVTAVDNTVDQTSRSIRLQGVIDNADGRLKGGMSFAIEMQFDGQTFPAVDPLSISWSSSGPFVWTIADGKAARVPVRIVQRLSGKVLVDANLGPDDQVITQGLQSLRPGAPVTVAQTGAAS